MLDAAYSGLYYKIPILNNCVVAAKREFNGFLNAVVWRPDLTNTIFGKCQTRDPAEFSCLGAEHLKIKTFFSPQSLTFTRNLSKMTDFI